jgi:hypothetical protein
VGADLLDAGCTTDADRWCEFTDPQTHKGCEACVSCWRPSSRVYWQGIPVRSVAVPALAGLVVTER